MVEMATELSLSMTYPSWELLQSQARSQGEGVEGVVRSPPPLGQKRGKGPLLETNLLHIQLVPSLGKYCDVFEALTYYDCS